MGRQSASEITCFHNFQGLGLQFAAIGSILYREALARNIGLSLDDRYFTQSLHP
jgi:ornithine cyclodeaminase/alanine dehydrogenase-like protein (mu-crystallin family)